MAKSNILNTRTINYLELIGNGKTYRVPPYQRDYSWSEEQWEDLWNDIVDLRSEPDRSHYLGALVIESKTDRDFLVIDGQQRLATLSLLALAVIDRLEAMATSDIESENNSERSRELRNRFIGEKDPASLIESSRLLLNATDDAFYQDYLIQLKDPRNPRKLPKSNLLLWDCFRYFISRLDELSELRNDGLAMASVLSETVARQFLFILITVDDELNAYTVFETLNARGLELTTTDLLKNYLFSRIKVSSDLAALQRRWQSLVNTVGQTRFPEFLRYHLLCEQPQIRSQRLFKIVRDQTKTAEDVFNLLDELEGRGELFEAILDSGHGYWMEDHLSKAKKYVVELNLFRIKQPMPLLFATWDLFTKEDFVRVLKLVSSISFRYTIVSGLNTNALEPVYHRAAKAVIDGKASTPSAVFELLKPIYVEDEKMKQDFTLLELDTRGRRKKLAKYILARLEEKTSNLHCDPDTDPGTIEHVLPENPSEEWKDVFPVEKWESSVYRLGNLTLLKASDNRAIGNKPYSIKLPVYEKSRYRVTQRIADLASEQWTPELINERQRILAETAKQIWRSDFAV